MCLFMCIICGYAAIAHFENYPIFGVMYYAMSFDGSLIYTLLYEKAFKVPALFKETKVQLRLRARQLSIHAGRLIYEKQAVSIPSMGIKVGGFHLLERTSTPVFLHYVVANVVNMLVVYK